MPRPPKRSIRLCGLEYAGANAFPGARPAGSPPAFLHRERRPTHFCLGNESDFDPAVLGDIFTYWAPLPPRTIFRGIREIPPGHYLLAHNGEVIVNSYWQT